MTAQIDIIAAGMVTAVGLDRASSCAAMRGRLDGFQETRFVAGSGEWQIGAPVPLPRNWIGAKRLAHLVSGAIVELLRQVPEAAHDAALILCLAEEERPGRLPADGPAFAATVAEIVSSLAAEYDASEDVVGDDVSGFLQVWADRRLVTA